MQSGFRAETRPWSPWRPWCQPAQQQPELLQQQPPPRSHLGPSLVNTEGFLFNSTDLISRNKFYILEDQQPAPVRTTVDSERVHVKYNKKPKSGKPSLATQQSQTDPNNVKPFSSNYPSTPVQNLHISSKTKSKTFKILACNVRSITNKHQSTLNLLHKQDVDIAVFSELNTKKLRKFPGYQAFTRYSQLRFHGVCMLINNDIKNNVLRVGEEDLELVHLRIDSCVPPLNILGTYLDVEAGQSTDQLDQVWSKLINKVNMIVESGESVCLLGDMNRSLQGKPSYGTKLLRNFLQENTMTLLNDETIPTRIDPFTKKGSILDLCLISNNIKSCIKDFKVDTSLDWTPYSESKCKGETQKKYTDHRSIMVEISMPVKEMKKGKRIPVINFANKEGWKKYPEISDKYAEKMINVINNVSDPDKLEQKLNFIDTEIAVECFGITWQGTGKKTKKKTQKELQEMYEREQNELDDLLSNGLKGKGLDNKMYKLRSLINGPKHAKQDPQAINHPETGDLITNREEIKKVSLEHNKKILTKNEVPKEHEDEIQKQKLAHKEIMESNDKDIWTLNFQTFKNVLSKIKDKGKNMYKNLFKSGDRYQLAVFLYMSKLIKTEQLPKLFARTSLSQIWKKKGSPLDLNNMRFIHMKQWRPRLLENLVTEQIKVNIVNATPHLQLGGKPGASSVEHLVVLKTWMKMLEQTNGKGIFQCWDMSKFFDKESLLDCLNTLKTKAGIDNKSYRLWYKLNENTEISVKTSVGESATATIPNTIGQGSVGAALVSSLNIGSAIAETFAKNPSTFIGSLGLHSLVFQDDISKMNDNLGQARDACNKIDNMLKRKQLSVNYDKSKFLIIGNSKYKKKILKNIKKDPMIMGGQEIHHSSVEKYLGDLIHEKGCVQSIKETVKKRIQGLISKSDEIIQLAESPIMGGLGNSTVAFRLFEATIIPALLHNAESWIGITDSIIKDLQNFQDKFIRKVLRLPKSTTKALYQWDSGMLSMKWRIAKRKLLFVNKIMQKDHTNIARKTLLQEALNKIEGLGHECSLFSDILGLPNLICLSRSKAEIKAAVKQQDRKEIQEQLESSKKVGHRLTDNPEDWSYLNTMPLHTARLWIRIRAYAIKGVKMNQKGSHKADLNCRFCTTNVPESQEHLEICAGMEFERWGLDLAERDGVLMFWRRVTVKLSKLAVATQPSRRGALI